MFISPDGSLALSGGGTLHGINDSQALTKGWDGFSHLWDLRSGQLLWSQSGFDGFLTRAGLRELRGDRLYSTLEQRPLGRLEGLAGDLLALFHLGVPERSCRWCFSCKITSLACTPRGAWLWPWRTVSCGFVAWRRGRCWAKRGQLFPVAGSYNPDFFLIGYRKWHIYH